MAKKLFVGGLSWNTTSEQLKAAFGAIGTVTDAVVISDRETGRSRGFGFVTFANDADADRALSEMNGTMLDGRAIKIDAATERAPGGPGRGPGGPGPRRGPAAPPPSFGPDRAPGGGFRGGGGGGGRSDRPRRLDRNDRRDREGARQRKRDEEEPKTGDYLDDEY
jgi:RNA recognition motif-containing protein